MDIIVVEGVHDVIKVERAIPNCHCVITNGSEISKETIEYIKELSKKNNIIVFTDPDSPGERIRKIIEENVPNCKHAFLRKKECISNNNKKVGIEHASVEAIVEALNHVYTPSDNPDTITINELYNLGLAGGSNSSELRDMISEYLNIGRPNSKTFLKRLNILQLTSKDLERIICELQ